MRTEYAIFHRWLVAPSTLVVLTVIGLWACGRTATESDGSIDKPKIVASRNDTSGSPPASPSPSPSPPAIATAVPEAALPPSDLAADGTVSPIAPGRAGDANPAATAPNPPPIARFASEVDTTGSAPSPAPVRKVMLTATWSVETETGHGDELLIGKDLVFVTTPWKKYGNIQLLALDKKDGRVIWKKPSVFLPVLHNDLIVAVSPLQALDAATGTRLWARHPRNRDEAHLAWAATDTFIAFVTLENVTPDSDRFGFSYSLTLVESRTGKELSRTEAPIPAGTAAIRDVEAAFRLFSLSFQDDGLWVANRRMPDDPGERAAWWAGIVEAKRRDWERVRGTASDIDGSRSPVAMPFGRLLGGSQPSQDGQPAKGPAAWDHDGREIAVRGVLPRIFAHDRGVIYARDGGRVMRIAFTTEP